MGVGIMWIIRTKYMKWSRLPSGLGDDHLGSELVKFVPQLFGLQTARDLRHLLARDPGIGGDERLRAHRGRAPAEVPVPVQGGQVSQRLLVAGGLLHKLFCLLKQTQKSTDMRLIDMKLEIHAGDGSVCSLHLNISLCYYHYCYYPHCSIRQMMSD